LRRGRFFDRTDTAQSTPVVIVDVPLARKFWPDRDPIGRRMWLPGSAEELAKGPGPNTRYLTVVGVVEPMRIGAVGDRDDARVGAYYFPHAQADEGFVTFAIRTTVEPQSVAASVQREIAALDPELPLYEIRTMHERMDETLRTRRTAMVLAVSFGGLALFLAAIGIYGVLAYQVTQRTREMGIRLALGSDARAIFALILREGLLLMAAGLAVGFAGAFALRTSIATQLYDVRPLDPAILALVAIVLGAVALTACAVPARRASRINPVIALGDQ